MYTFFIQHFNWNVILVIAVLHLHYLVNALLLDTIVSSKSFVYDVWYTTIIGPCHKPTLGLYGTSDVKQFYAHAIIL